MPAPAIAIAVTLLVGLITIQNWRWGLVSIIAVGVLQDVLRKMTPGVPSYYIIWSAAVFGGVALVAVTRGSLGSIRSVWFGDEALKSAFNLYFLLIALHILHALLRWGTPVIPVFGAVFYLGPVVTLLLVIGFARDVIWMDRFVKAYLMIMVPVTLTIYLSPVLMDRLPVLREVGSFVGAELKIYDVGTVLYSYPGLMRVGEIAAFHAATCVALLTMAIYERRPSLARRIVYIALIVALVGAIAMTGRRKMLMTLTLFWVFQFFLLSVLRRGITRRLVVVLLVGIAVAVGFGVMSQGESSSMYLTRGVSVFSSVGARFDTAVMLLESALGRSSWLGLGAGTASQGMRYSGVDVSRYVGGSAESGIGYIAVELGLPGLLVIVWVGYNLLRVLWVQLKRVARINDQSLIRAVSYAALLAANAATFVVATQLYGDYFVLIVLGVFAGGLYSAIYDAYGKYAVLKRYQLAQQQRMPGQV